MTDKNSKNTSLKHLPRTNPLLIRRKEIIELFGRSGSFVDSFIKKQEDFPKQVSYGCYSRKEVEEWLKNKGFL
ncbi:hypothetical protein [Vibrio vulnificus YJ016]|uniref:AlpA family phage regulatory protein n=2 Tax=Vibrio vulnificus TaxID=672 RepID=Q7ME12_VIBVY|nr:AlpA family phage regulatory protein [Vibrio vulnificus]MBN8120525.1 AlpA family phage regulatory protein [Vibrio vulnificus]MCJ0820210.1 AlpA family phage regulatory protein [Vibrio vulnificus]BAC96898.1 hypothetical protein [Vibrio vulnificus YJ016]HAS6086780.1 AlpA family phage regulatory protein [Vibrio vulnificus]HAS6208979.1 AlpA family phage regulatory protein [Vibrio vulnificus]